MKKIIMTQKKHEEMYLFNIKRGDYYTDLFREVLHNAEKYGINNYNQFVKEYKKISKEFKKEFLKDIAHIVQKTRTSF